MNTISSNTSPLIFTLKCQGCGANLEIRNNTDQFACSYCGTQQIVIKHGGIVELQLKNIEKSTREIQISSEKTASELAITRLLNEIEQISIQYLNKNNQLEKQLNLFAKIITFFISLAIFSIIDKRFGLFLIFGAISTIIGFFLLNQWKEKNAASKWYREKRQTIEDEIASHKKNIYNH